MPFSPLTLEERNFPVQIAQIVPRTRAEGPGERFAIWFQGCPFRCPGCCNPEMLRFEGGETIHRRPKCSLKFKPRRRLRKIWKALRLLGGEPLAHAGGAAKIAREARRLGLSVMIFTGYRWEEIEQNPDEAIQELIAHTDLLVDGLYERDQPELTRRWIGSANQEIYFLTDRYSPDDACWRETDTLEIRLEQGNLTINGFPANSAVGLWKRLPGSRRRNYPRNHALPRGKSEIRISKSETNPNDRNSNDPNRGRRLCLM